MIDFDEVALKLAKAEADKEVLQKALNVAIECLEKISSKLQWCATSRALTALNKIREITGELK